VPSWRPGDTIPLGTRSLQVIDVRVGEDESVLVVGEAEPPRRDLTRSCLVSSPLGA
jgi:hypothetical protein